MIILISENELINVKSYNVLHSVDNLSDHSPVQVTLNNINVPYEIYTSEHVVERLNWHSASEVNIQHFVSVTDDLLCNLSIPWQELTCRDNSCSSCNKKKSVVFTIT